MSQTPTVTGTLLPIIVTVTYSLCIEAYSHSQPQNILFLVADDLRLQMEPYLGPGFPSLPQPAMITPNLDRLADRSLLVKRAYVQQALCSPSRSSFLTSRRPETTHVHDNSVHFREVGGNFTTLPQHLKDRGYRTMALGKIYHPSQKDPLSWTDPHFEPPNLVYWDNAINESWAAIPLDELEIMPLPETQLADEATQRLGELAASGEPFFMAVGMYKPHLSFVFPENYLDYYPESEISLPDNPYVPENFPQVAWYNQREIMSYTDIEALNVTGEYNTTLPDDVTLYLRRAYYAAVSYVDDMLGRILDELDAVGLSNNTVISMIGDHGWQLGEHAEWGKSTNFDLATQAPMMIHIPGVTDSGLITDELVEFVDLYPTLIDAIGQPEIPACTKNLTAVTPVCTEGRSFMQLFYNETAGWKNRAFSQYPREDAAIMGYSIRTHIYRYTEWVNFTLAPDYAPDWSVVHGIELYDHKNDFYENTNVVSDPSYADVIEELSGMLHDGWWGIAD